MATCLLDTNILLYLANSGAPEHHITTNAITRMLAAGDRLVLAPQVLFEFWTVATRDVSANGLGWTVSQTRAGIESFRAKFTVLAEPPEVVDLCLDLVTTYGIRGKRIHDAHLLATMKANGVDRLLTLNVGDFPDDPAFTILAP
jgi:predicted nucleic acid-binding protein